MVRTTKSFWKSSGGIAILVAIIGAIGIIIASLIPYFIGQFQGDKKRVTLAPIGQLEQDLSNANIILSDVNPDQIRKWLRSEPAYHILAQNCLKVMRGMRVNDTVSLDVINSKYRELHGYPPDKYLLPDKYDDMDKLKIAIFTAWKERHSAFPQTSFDQIVEGNN